MEVREQYHVEISNRSACLENMWTSMGLRNILERISKF
jgi:hypothetical protein